MSIFLIIWLSISFLIIFGGIFWEGYAGEGDSYGNIVEIIIIGLFWPPFILVLILYLPFWLVYKLGCFLRK